MEVPLQSKIFVAGHKGLVGSALVRCLKRRGYHRLALRTRSELDLRNQKQVKDFFESENPDFVFVAAARVGGIWANSTFRGDFILENLQIQTNIVSAAFETHVKKLVFLGSSCIYPKHAHQPIQEDALLSGPLESTNEAYAVAKIAGIMLCKSLMIQYGKPYISLMLTNLYGQGDHYDLETSHVLPGLIRRFHEAKIQKTETVTAWGTGKPFREFLHADDAAEAAFFALQNYHGVDHLNVGSGEEVSIAVLAELVKKAVGFQGEIVWDHSRPDGTPRKLMDSSRFLSLGWKPAIQLEEGIRLAYQDFLSRFGTRM